MARDACEKFVGPMPVDEFLSEFVPEATEVRPEDKFMFPASSVSQNEDDFIRAIEASGLCPKLKFINTTTRQDGQYRLKPDISIYSDKHLSDDPETERWKTLDLWIENKNNGDDIFRTVDKMRRKVPPVERHIKHSEAAYKICGQLLSYASALHHSQFRVFSFAVILFGDSGRLLRWDRSGIIYSESFNWADQPDTLFEFFWRLNFLSDVDRGYDTTVTSVTDDEVEVALNKLKTYEGLENVQAADLHQFLVHDDHSTDGRPGRYIAPSPIWDTKALFGRSTFGYIAYDVASTDLVYLKDFWRTALPDIQKEGDVYRELHNAQVPHIPTLGRAGDVPLSPNHVNALPFAVQRTKTRDYVGREWCPGRPCVEPYVHYRLVLKTLGRPLNTFRSTRQLCEVIRDAIEAHTAAYEKAQILHRDVSAGNILIADDGSGMLIDWDLSKKVIKDVDREARSHSRTGTWQFISISRLRDPSTRPHEVSDDLESFFWVLLYEVTKCRNVRGANLSGELQSVFDQHSEVKRDGTVTGGAGKRICLKSGYFDPLMVLDLVKTPCKDIIEELRALFRDFYFQDRTGDDLGSDILLLAERLRESDPKVKDARERLSSSQWIFDMINRHLASKWDVDNDGSLYTILLRPNPSASRKRKRKAPSDGDSRETSNKIPKGRLRPSESVPSGNGSSSRSRGHRGGSLLTTSSSRTASHSTTYSSLLSRSSNLNPGAG
ncbi:hypothetical protein BC827DRAFT_1379725 [Russula dissimulans]|nr:hypothetical protein BC827DRAFT_1379725 [Russula dissimulans]